MDRRVARIGVAVCLALAFGLVARAWVVLHDPTWLPGWDGSGYVRRALQYHDLLVSGDLRGLFDLLVRPDIRPPLFGLLLGSLALFAAKLAWAFGARPSD